MYIKPSAAIRQNYNDIAELCKMTGEPVYLTKNGYGAMVVLSLEQYASLTDNIEAELDEADYQASIKEERLSHETVFRNARGAVYGK